MQCLSRISVVAMSGAAIVIDDMSAADTILSIKERIFAANCKMPVRRQRLVYRSGPRGMEPLADDETLGGAGVAHDGTAELDVLMADLTAAELANLGKKVCLYLEHGWDCCHFFIFLGSSSHPFHYARRSFRHSVIALTHLFSNF
jgi:hypothetical protein